MSTTITVSNACSQSFTPATLTESLYRAVFSASLASLSTLSHADTYNSQSRILPTVQGLRELCRKNWLNGWKGRYALRTYVISTFVTELTAPRFMDPHHGRQWTDGRTDDGHQMLLQECRWYTRDWSGPLVRLRSGGSVGIQMCCLNAVRSRTCSIALAPID